VLIVGAAPGEELSASPAFRNKSGAEETSKTTIPFTVFELFSINRFEQEHSIQPVKIKKGIQVLTGCGLARSGGSDLTVDLWLTLPRKSPHCRNHK
jgi:hypothetical protein